MRIRTRSLTFGLLSLSLLLLPLSASSSVHATGLAKRHRPAPRDTGQTIKIFGTSVVSGAMDGTVTITMSGGFSVGELANFDWDLPLAQSIQVGGYDETVTGETFTFSEPPNTSQDLVDLSHPELISVRRFHWDSPQPNTQITVSETLHLALHSDLSPFSSTAPFPMGGVLADVQPFLTQTDSLKLPSSADAIVSKLRSSGSSEQQVVQAVQDWVASNTVYQAAPNQPFNATWVFDIHRGNCQGYDDLMQGLLRKLGIPSRTVFGWVSAATIKYPGPSNSFSSLNWSLAGTPGELHTWLQAYFPDVGWVSFDPQEEKFFSDVRHLAFFTGLDAQIPKNYGVWAANLTGTNEFGQNFSSGTPIFVPGDGITSKVSLTNQDHFNMAFRQQLHDVSSLIMFSR